MPSDASTRDARPRRPVLAVDVGGTKTAVALVTPDAAVHHEVRIRTPLTGDPEAAWAQVSRAADAVLRSAGSAYGGIAGIGIGSAGPIDPGAGTISPVMIPVWRDAPVCAWAQAWAPGAPVTLAGDGISTAIGEHWAGAGRDTRNVLACTVSTGVGGGLILDGRPHMGRTFNAGHFGHLVFDADGPPCLCGGRGCLELFASGTALLSRATAAGWQGAHAAATTRDLADAARAGDPVAVEAFRQAGRALAAGFASVGALCDLDIVVVGGGVAQAGSVLFDAINGALPEFAALPFLEGLTVRPAQLGQQAGLVGAAAALLAPDIYGAVTTPGLTAV